MTTTRIELAGLTAYVVASVEKPTATCVPLHGFGAPGDDLVSLADALDPRVALRVP